MRDEGYERTIDQLIKENGELACLARDMFQVLDRSYWSNAATTWGGGGAVTSTELARFEDKMRALGLREDGV